MLCRFTTPFRPQHAVRSQLRLHGWVFARRAPRLRSSVLAIARRVWTLRASGSPLCTTCFVLARVWVAPVGKRRRALDTGCTAARFRLPVSHRMRSGSRVMFPRTWNHRRLCALEIYRCRRMLQTALAIRLRSPHGRCARGDRSFRGPSLRQDEERQTGPGSTLRLIPRHTDTRGCHVSPTR